MCSNRLFLAAALFAVGLGAACSRPGDIVITSPAPITRPPELPATGSCDHTRAQWAIGQPASADLLARARDAAGAQSARFLRPNDVITMEYLASRLNVHLDARDIVRSVTCG